MWVRDVKALEAIGGRGLWGANKFFTQKLRITEGRIFFQKDNPHLFPVLTISY